MASSSGRKDPRVPIIASLVPFLLLLLVSCSAALASAKKDGGGKEGSQAPFRAGDERAAYRRIVSRMARMEKDSNKTIQAIFLVTSYLPLCLGAGSARRRLPGVILGLGSLCMQSPDGDIIHCVPSHRQPAFDHPKLRGQKPEVKPSSSYLHLSLRPFHSHCCFCSCRVCAAHQMSRCNVHTSSSSLRSQDEPAVRPVPKGAAAAEEEEASSAALFPQAWSDGGERCPEGTVPIRRTTARDVLRVGSARRFGMKPRASNARRDSTSSGHEVS